MTSRTTISVVPRCTPVWVGYWNAVWPLELTASPGVSLREIRCLEGVTLLVRNGKCVMWKSKWSRWSYIDMLSWLFLPTNRSKYRKTVEVMLSVVSFISSSNRTHLAMIICLVRLANRGRLILSTPCSVLFWTRFFLMLRPFFLNLSSLRTFCVIPRYVYFAFEVWVFYG